MKNNKGITLVALVITVVLLIIFTSAAIYTSINSYSIIDIQKYKSQMQVIQNAVDEFYEEYQNAYKKNEADLIIGDTKIDKENFIHLYIFYKQREDKAQTLKDFLADPDKIEIIDGEFVLKNNEIENITAIVEQIENENTTPARENAIQWWNNIAATMFGISINESLVKENYYYFTPELLEEFFSISDINISDGFIINFKDRYVFSTKPIEVTTSEIDSSTNEPKTDNIYCLYQLNEEEKIINFETKSTGGNLEIDIIEKTLSYQTISIKLKGGQESIIKQVYFTNDDDLDLNSSTETEDSLIVENRKDLFSEVNGLGTKEVIIKVKEMGTYKFMAKDVFEGLYASGGGTTVAFHEQPILENNMIPITSDTDGTTATVYPKDGSDDINEWYNYKYTEKKDNSGKIIKDVVKDDPEFKYAAVVISNSGYEENKGKSFPINRSDKYIEPNGNEGTHIVKVWIPYTLRSELLKENYNSIDFIGKTGIWVTAKWENNKWVPDERLRLSTIVESFSKDKLTINLSTGISNMKYYWKLNDATDDKYISTNTYTDTYTGIEETDVDSMCLNGILELKDNDDNPNILQKIRSVSIYGIAPNGNKTTVKIVKRTEKDISAYNELEAFYSAQLNLTSGKSEITQNLNKNLKNKYINNNYYYASAYAKKASESEGDSIEFYFPPVGEIDKLGRDYLKKNANELNKYGVLKKITAGRTNDPLYLRVDYDSNSSKNITNTLYVERIILINTTKLKNDYSYVEFDNVDWCKKFIDMMNDGENDKVIMYCYE